LSNGISIGSVRAVSVRLMLLARGAWFAEVDVDPDSAPVTAADIPTGPVTVTITPSGGTPIVLQGTVDPTEGGRFGSSVKVLVLAGGGGWSKPVAAQDFNNPGGVSALTVEQTTAALVGETVTDLAPLSLGLHWVREAGPASSIWGDRPWYVDLTGVTQAAAWPPATPDASVEILDWDPEQQRGVASVDALLLPGTVLTDPRFDGSVTVRDVELAFRADGARAIFWCSSTVVTRLMSAFTNMVRQLGQIASLKLYAYRVVTVAGAGQWNLQAVNNADGTKSVEPDLLNVPVWPGLFGLSCTPPLSSNVLVAFLNGNRGAPVIVASDGTLPVKAAIDATAEVDVGPSAPVVALAGGTQPLATGPWATGLMTAMTAFSASLAALTTAPLTPVGAAGSTLQTALKALPTPETTKTVAA
jgi:hypothetical protein